MVYTEPDYFENGFVKSTYKDVTYYDAGNFQVAKYVQDNIQGTPLGPANQAALVNGNNSIFWTKDMADEMKGNYDVAKATFAAEYEYYKDLYETALKDFLDSMKPDFSSENIQTERADRLRYAIEYNRRLNTLFSLMNYYSVSYSVSAGTKIMTAQELETTIAEKTRTLNQEYDILNADNKAIMNHKTMIQYGEEKNNYVTNQISLWAALNVLALGTIFYVYRQM
jgi:hypothetical protein